MPNFFAFFAHLMPLWFHRIEVLLTFFEQLVLPFFVISPVRSLRIFGAILEIFLQFFIFFTGNYAWINFIGVLVCFSCFDDHFLSFFFFKSTVHLSDKSRIKNIAFPSKKDSKVLQSTSSRSTNLKKISPPKNKINHKKKILVNFYKNLRLAIYFCLVCFIVIKSVDPIKEMYSESPWLHYYDDFFFVSSQGVFGFVNSKRVVLSLFFTHQNHSSFHFSGCLDVKETPFVDQNTKKKLNCKEISNYCNHPSYGHEIQKFCAKTCGKCDYQIPDNIKWENLDYKNLPGASLNKIPSFNSPIHYRFDWEVWIYTTASMENYQNLPLSVPSFIYRSIQKILAGDQSTISLFGTPLSHLMDSNQNPPLAIKAQFYTYQFSNLTHLLSKGEWWEAKVKNFLKKF